MKAIMLMFDSLNRHMLPPYGCTWTHAPHFGRLAERTVTFERSYICSMPCMPARRDLHTGRPSFLHRSWGPLEPFDDSVPQILRDHGIHTHLVSDHYHYWEDGGSTYHNRYSTSECVRGQEGDPCIGQVRDPVIPDCVDVGRTGGANWRQDWINRSYMREEAQWPQARTMKAGLEFIHRNHDADNWLLQIETFDPHEPFFSPRQYKDRFAQHYDHYQGKHFDWPAYRPVQETPQEVEHARHEYASLLAMCDASLGQVLDAMDQLRLWDDTMLIVWTDHGFMLGEHDCWGKSWMPFYEEVAHTPLFLWDPRSGKRGERRQALVQPAIDLGPTLLRHFGLPPTADMLGCALADAVASDTAVRDAAIFGIAGGYVNVTDGRYLYLRAPACADNQPLFEYTLMPTRMRGFFPRPVLKDAQLSPPFSFTKGCPTMKIPWTWPSPVDAPPRPTLLFDLQTDPQQRIPIRDEPVERRMLEHMVRLMKACDAPAEQYQRLGIEPISGA
ncbi:MAG: sulfatase [Phycisphaeraceae bacterium]